MLPFSQPSCYFKTRPPSCALGTSFYTVSEGRDLMTYVNDNYTSYSAPSPLNLLLFLVGMGTAVSVHALEVADSKAVAIVINLIMLHVSTF